MGRSLRSVVEPGRLTSARYVRELLRAHAIRPRKRWGQNFLVDQVAREKIVAALEPRRTDRLLEVGAGLGTLTVAVAPRVEQVVAVEVDRRLLPLLRSALDTHPNVTLIEGDILEADLGALLVEHRVNKICGNLPYSISTPLLFRLFSVLDQVELAVVLVQREIAQRMLAEPGTADYGSLSVAVRYRARVERLALLAGNSFFPRPEVDSALLRLRPRKAELPAGEEETLFRVVRAAFSQRRKQLANALAAGLGWTKERAQAALTRAGVAPEQRGEELSLGEFVRVARVIHHHDENQGIEVTTHA